MEEVADLFGKLCKDYFENGNQYSLQLEFDNGFVIDDFPVSFYVDSNEMRKIEIKFLCKIIGKTLDIGCGAGRLGLYLQQIGLKSLGLDKSECMVDICKRRGLEAYVMDINHQLPFISFNNIIMFGNGFGLPGSIENIKNLLRRLQTLTSIDAIIIAESNDPNKMQDRIDIEYQRRNLKLGRYMGQRKWRIKSDDLVGPFEDWVQLEPQILKRVAGESGWRIDELEYEPESKWGSYFFSLKKN